MDYFGKLWAVTLCSWLVGWCVCHEGLGRKVVNDAERVSPKILEMGLWEMFLGVWSVLAVFSILAISMARSKNRWKGKRKGHSSESEKESEREDEEIEAMFAESPESEREKWVQSVERRGFHCERGMKIETFLFTHPIRAVIHDQNL